MNNKMFFFHGNIQIDRKEKANQDIHICQIQMTKRVLEKKQKEQFKDAKRVLGNKQTEQFEDGISIQNETSK